MFVFVVIVVHLLQGADWDEVFRVSFSGRIQLLVLGSFRM